MNYGDFVELSIKSLVNNTTLSITNSNVILIVIQLILMKANTSLCLLSNMWLYLDDIAPGLESVQIRTMFGKPI